MTIQERTSDDNDKVEPSQEPPTDSSLSEKYGVIDWSILDDFDLSEWGVPALDEPVFSAPSYDLVTAEVDVSSLDLNHFFNANTPTQPNPTPSEIKAAVVEARVTSGDSHATGRLVNPLDPEEPAPNGKNASGQDDLSPFATEHLNPNGDNRFSQVIGIDEQQPNLPPYLHGASHNGNDGVITETPDGTQMIEPKDPTLTRDEMEQLRGTVGTPFDISQVDLEDNDNYQVETQRNVTLIDRAAQTVTNVLQKVNGLWEKGGNVLQMVSSAFETKVTVEQSGALIETQTAESIELDEKAKDKSKKAASKLADSMHTIVNWAETNFRDASMDDWTEEQRDQYQKTLAKEVMSNIGTMVGFGIARGVLLKYNPALAADLDIMIQQGRYAAVAALAGFGALRTISLTQPLRDVTERKDSVAQKLKGVTDFIDQKGIKHLIKFGNLISFASAGLMVGQHAFPVQHETYGNDSHDINHHNDTIHQHPVEVSLGSTAEPTGSPLPTAEIHLVPTTDGVVHLATPTETHTAANILVPTSTSTETHVPATATIHPTETPTHEPTPQPNAAPLTDIHAGKPTTETIVAPFIIPGHQNQVPLDQHDRHAQIDAHSQYFDGAKAGNEDLYYGAYGDKDHPAMVIKAGTTSLHDLKVDDEYEKQLRDALAEKGMTGQIHGDVIDEDLNKVTKLWLNNGISDDIKTAQGTSNQDTLHAQVVMLESGNHVGNHSSTEIVDSAIKLGAFTPDTHALVHPSVDISPIDHVQAPNGAEVNGTLLDDHNRLTYNGHAWNPDADAAGRIAQAINNADASHQVIDMKAVREEIQYDVNLWVHGRLDNASTEHQLHFNVGNNTGGNGDSFVKDHYLEPAKRAGMVDTTNDTAQHALVFNHFAVTSDSGKLHDGDTLTGSVSERNLTITHTNGQSEIWQPDVPGVKNIATILGSSIEKLYPDQLKTNLNAAIALEARGNLDANPEYHALYELCVNKQILHGLSHNDLLGILRRLQIVS
jgi:hypothetical protein